MKKPIFIQATSSDRYMQFQTEVQLHNFRKLGYSDNYRVLIFVAKNRPEGESTNDDISGWIKLNEEYPEAKFFYYYDEEDILNTYIRPINYIPLLRLYCLKKHFAEYPELRDEVIFYHDADIIFTRELPFEKYVGDNICYLSNTKHYLGLQYLESKVNDALPDKKQTLIELDPISKIAQAAGITKDIIISNDNGVGGAQYLLKNIDAQFWEDCYNACINLRFLFNNLTKYFENGNKSYQGFCSDMWAVLYTLWKRGYSTETPSDFDFAWATDSIEKLDKVYIYHNAGITGKIMNLGGQDELVFYKGAYANNDKTPFQTKENKYLQSVSTKYANRFYVDTILEINNPITI